MGPFVKGAQPGGSPRFATESWPMRSLACDDSPKWSTIPLPAALLASRLRFFFRVSAELTCLFIIASTSPWPSFFPFAKTSWPTVCALAQWDGPVRLNLAEATGRARHDHRRRDRRSARRLRSRGPGEIDPRPPVYGDARKFSRREGHRAGEKVGCRVRLPAGVASPGWSCSEGRLRTGAHG